jgi:hypothetical protein
VPEYCRPAAAVAVPFFACPVSSKIRNPAVGAEVPGEEGSHRIPRRVLVPAGAFEQVVQTVGPIQADRRRDRPAVARDLRHQQSAYVRQAVGSHVAAAVDRREVRRELGEYRFHQLGIYAGGAGRPVVVMRHNIMIAGRPAAVRTTATAAVPP